METGLFIANYIATTGAAGAQTLTLKLAVSTPNEKISGMGHITQAVNPPLNIYTELKGDYTYMTVMPKNTHILVVLEGSEDVKIRMVLEDDWSKGVANYQYKNEAGELNVLKNIPVKIEK